MRMEERTQLWDKAVKDAQKILAGDRDVKSVKITWKTYRETDACAYIEENVVPELEIVFYEPGMPLKVETPLGVEQYTSETRVFKEPGVPMTIDDTTGSLTPGTRFWRDE